MHTQACMTREQRKIVEDNIGLVGKVIKDKVRDINTMGMFTYDDLFQIGCEGLCKAAMDYTVTPEAAFSTYAYRAIYNKICDAMRYASLRRHREPVMDLETIHRYTPPVVEELENQTNVNVLISNIMNNASSATRKGIKAILLRAEGYSYKEIGALLNASPGLARTWVSRTRKWLMTIPELAELDAA